MFGTWISDVQRALLAVFPADRAYSAEDLKSPEMPTPIGTFLSNALRRRVARIEFSVESEWFDPEASEVKSAFQAYRQALASTARYPAGVWEASLERAVQLVIQHHVNPADGLVSFVFGESEDPVPVARIRDRLDYFGLHDPLRDLVVMGLERKSVNELGPVDVRAIVLQADRTLVDEFEADHWVDHLGPLYDVARVLVEEKGEPELPTDLLKTLFEAKNCLDIVDRLEAVESVKGVHGLTVDVLRRAVAIPEPVVEVVEPEPEPAPEIQVKRVVRNDIHREGESAVVPRWMQFANGSKEAAPEPPQPVDPPKPPRIEVEPPDVAPEEDKLFELEASAKIGQRAPVPDDLGIVSTGDGMDRGGESLPVSGESVPRWTQFRTAKAAQPSQSVEPPRNDVEERVMGRLNAVQRAWFINHLFGSDQRRWATVINLLASADDWNEASEIIATEVFERHGVDIYSRPAVDFTNAVEARFR